MPYFMMGFVLADCYLTDWQDDVRRSVWWDCFGVGSWIVLCMSFLMVLPARHLLIAMLLFFFCFGVFRGRILRTWLSKPPITVIGGMCYSIYLLHQHLMKLLVEILPAAPFTNSVSLMTLVCVLFFASPILLVSACFFKLIEKPCMDPNWPGKLWRRISASARKPTRDPASPVTNE